jgi:hypothetical protein
MTEAELLQILIIEVNDFHTTVAQAMAEGAVRSDAIGGFIHLLAAGIAVACGLLTWIGVMVTRR